MSYTFEQLKEDVRKEAEALRKHATPQELSRLNLSKLEPEDLDSCIYGQMTGSCYSRRACDLISICAIRYIADGDLAYVRRDGFDRVAKYVTNEPIPDTYIDRTSGSEETHYSAIEAYILLPEANNANLIAFLRGETETLEL
jgi:hypothetical protein